MKLDDKDILQAAATIVAAHISAKTYQVDMAESGNVAGALADAITEVKAGIAKRAADDKAHRKAVAPTANQVNDIAKKLAR